MKERWVKRGMKKAGWWKWAKVGSSSSSQCVMCCSRVCSLHYESIIKRRQEWKSVQYSWLHPWERAGSKHTQPAPTAACCSIRTALMAVISVWGGGERRGGEIQRDKAEGGCQNQTDHQNIPTHPLAKLKQHRNTFNRLAESWSVYSVYFNLVKCNESDWQPWQLSATLA